MEGQGRLLHRPGESRQGLAINLVVGESYEPPVPAPVMPLEHLLTDEQALHHVQDELDVSNKGRRRVVVGFIVLIWFLTSEEVGRRQLPVVAGRNGLPRLGKGADGLCWRNVRRLVEDNHVEEMGFRGNHLGHL